jgi:hypothetical protein
VPEAFSSDSRIREVLTRLGERGRDLLRKHGYDTGEGFVDSLSQYQSLERAARSDRIRDLLGLLRELNSLT